jgi:D-amino peptidase
MNVYILTDMEGISLVTEWEQVTQGHSFYPKYQAILAAEVNAAVEGALAAGASRIVVNDGHGSKDYNLLWDKLHPIIELERPDSPTHIFPSLDESFDAMLLIGYHAMEGTPNAVLAHTQSHQAISFFELNGKRYGEIGQMSIIAGHFGVPIAYISGDQAAVSEARGIQGSDLPATVVKKGHANGKATSLHPDESVRRIRSGVEQALKAARRQPYCPQGPYEVRHGYKSKEATDLRATSEFRRIDDFTITKTIHSAKDILS